MLMDQIQDYMDKTAAQRDLLNVQKGELAEEKKIMPSFHLSLQSGSNAILAAMKRKYRLSAETLP